MFGFLAFSGFLVGLAWEFTKWYHNRSEGDLCTNTATVVQGPTKCKFINTINTRVVNMTS